MTLALDWTRTRARIHDFEVRGIKKSVQLLQDLSPALAARGAELLFLSPRRHVRPEHERAALASAERSYVLHAGVRVPVYAWGKGPAVLFAHGWEGRGSQVAPFVAPLVAAGFRAVAYDVPSHGEAARGFVSVVDFAEVARSVARAIGEVQAGIGHSVGATALTLAAARDGFAERLALIAPPLSPRGFLGHFASELGLSDEARRLLVARLDARYGVRFDELDVRDSAPRVRAAALILHDRGDLEVPHYHGEKLAAAWPGAAFVSTEGLGHRRILRAAEVVERVVAFVGSPWPGTRLERAIGRDLYDREQRMTAAV